VGPGLLFLWPVDLGAIVFRFMAYLGSEPRFSALFSVHSQFLFTFTLYNILGFGMTGALKIWNLIFGRQTDVCF
jgi:hypothetical protein